MPLSQNSATSFIRRKQPRVDWEGNLISWMARGDEAAFKLFYDATNGLLFGLLLRILGHTQVAEEALSELYEEVRQKASRFGAQNERPVTWLIFIAHRRAMERLCCNLTLHKHKTPTFINITEQRRLIRAALDSIPYPQQQMIEMSFFAGMSNQEIAAEFEVSPETVEGELRHALMRLFGLFRSMGFSPTNSRETLDN